MNNLIPSLHHPRYLYSQHRCPQPAVRYTVFCMVSSKTINYLKLLSLAPWSEWGWQWLNWTYLWGAGTQLDLLVRRRVLNSTYLWGGKDSDRPTCEEAGTQLNLLVRGAVTQLDLLVRGQWLSLTYLWVSRESAWPTCEGAGTRLDQLVRGGDSAQRTCEGGGDWARPTCEGAETKLDLLVMWQGLSSTFLWVRHWLSSTYLWGGRDSARPTCEGGWQGLSLTYFLHVSSLNSNNTERATSNDQG